MAALIGVIRGDRIRHNSDARSTRLADQIISAEANTWRTFATVTTDKYGNVSVIVTRDGRTMHTWALGPER